MSGGKSGQQGGHYFDLFDFFAGGLAGIIAKTVTAPIERVKLLLQTEHENTKLKTKYLGISDCFTRCVKEEGVISLWRGNGVNVIRYFPTQALNFSTKDFYGRLLKVADHRANHAEFLLYNILCGGLAGSTTTCFVHPLDFARTRLAVDLGKSANEREYRGLADCIKKVFRSDGIRGLYSGFVVAFLSIFVYRGLYFGVYDFGKKSLLDESRIYPIQNHRFYGKWVGRRHR
jgi:solute carrier family 25 (mitochondrial adenine nucleotide translocator), member 4/5/6/31